MIIGLKGNIDFASAEHFYQVCMGEFTRKKLVFNLKKLHFVGSDGLGAFMDTIKDLQKESQIQFCCVSSEFQKVFADSEIKDIEIYEDESSAIKAF